MEKKAVSSDSVKETRAHNDYVELRVDFDFPTSEVPVEVREAASDVLAQLLADEGYESFLPDEKGLTAYIPVEKFSEDAIARVQEAFPMPFPLMLFSHKLIVGENWNEEWEKHYFKPIVVGNQCVIHSSFHKDIPQCAYDITIDPKMAFGTGHHATTSQVIEGLLALPLEGKKVIDMGTGTGILAILAAMRGAKEVTAIEIDPVAAENAQENIICNGHPEIKVLVGDASLLTPMLGEADVFIANINRNIITGDLSRYASVLKLGGVMLLSGFYEKDIPVIMAVAEPLGLVESSHTVKGDGWTCLHLRKKL